MTEQHTRARTAGPLHEEHWSVVEYEGGALAVHYDDDNRVCFMALPGTLGKREDVERRAHCIAAAPDMLRALHKIENIADALFQDAGRFDPNPNQLRGLRDAARAAIALAEGGGE